MDDSGQKSRFGQAYFANILVEIGQRSLAKSMDGKTAAISQINFVGIKFKNLFFMFVPPERKLFFGNCHKRCEKMVEDSGCERLELTDTSKSEDS